MLFRRKRRILRIQGLLSAVALATAAHTASTRPVWGFGGVVPLPGPQNRTQGCTGPSFGFLSRTSLPLPPKGGRGWVSSNLARWDFNAEKPGAFPQEKTDASYPRASLGSCLWQLPATTGLRWPNRACLVLRWCRSLPGSQNRTQGRTGPSLVFSPQNELTPPPKGGGAGYHLSWVGRVCPARSKLGHAGPTGPVWGFAGVVPLPGSQNRTQGHTGPCLVFTVFFSHLFSLAAWSVAAPGGNSPLLGWVGSCKAASRFSQSRPMSTPLSARFR